MAIIAKYPHINAVDGEPARLTRIPRVRVAQIIMDHFTHGWSAEEICRQYPHLKPAEVHAAFLYYFDHKDAIEREIEDECKEAERLAKRPHSSPFFLRLSSQQPP
jgi:uncharacterized protein (DUF433 family)